LHKDNDIRITILDRSSPVSSKIGIPRGAASWGNACTLGTSSKPQNLATFSFLSSILNPPKKTPSKDMKPRDASPEEKREHNRHKSNKQFQAKTFLDPYFIRWGLTYLKALIAGTGFKATTKWTEDERICLLDAISETLNSEERKSVRMNGRLIVNLDPEYSSDNVKHLKQQEACLDVVETIVSGTRCDDDGQGSCEDVGSNLLRRLERDERVTISFGSHVESILMDDKGSASGVKLSDGTKLQASSVVVCSGASSAEITTNAGAYVPIQPLRGYSLTLPVSKNTHLAVRDCVVVKPYQLYTTRTISENKDCVRFTCYGEMSPVKDCMDTPTPELFDQLEDLVKHVYKTDLNRYTNWEQRVRWMGCRPLSPDSSPVAGRTGVQNLYICSGGSFNGWRASFLSARVVAAAYAEDQNFQIPDSWTKTSQKMNNPLSFYRAAYSLKRFS
jgi:glycine/D-amino acid oxidase-like deaminating enzyme